jgi:hypothetical protein
LVLVSRVCGVNVACKFFSKIRFQVKYVSNVRYLHVTLSCDTIESAGSLLRVRRRRRRRRRRRMRRRRRRRSLQLM